MRCLPEINSGGNLWRLPLSASTAELLAQWLLEANPTSLANQLRSQLSSDPALALWLLCKAHASSAEPRTLAELATWFTKHADNHLATSALLTWRDQSAPTAHQAQASTTSRQAEAGRLTTAAQHLATASHHHAVQAAHPHPDEVSLVALLYHHREWFALADPASAEWGNPPIPPWLTHEYAALANPSEASPSGIATCIKAALTQPAEGLQRQAEVINVWKDTAPAWSRLLPELAQQTSRVNQLEQHFAEQLEVEKLEAMAELAAGAGHEINNPLAVISGRAQLLLRDEHDPSRKRALASIHAQALRVHEMISDLMLFGRPPQLELQSIDLVDVLDDLTSDLTTIAEPRRIDVATVVHAAELPLQADPVQLTVALRAITDNAVEAIGEGGQIRIEVSAVELSTDAASDAVRHIEIALRDDGPGIPPEVRRHLFDPFFSGRSAGRGLGFGLTKCWRIVTAHGGQIDVTSEPGHGTEFRIVLPAIEVPQSQPVILGERS